MRLRIHGDIQSTAADEYFAVEVDPEFVFLRVFRGLLGADITIEI